MEWEKLLESNHLPRCCAGLADDHQQIIVHRYAQILPIVEQLLTLHDIRERNRTWPGVSPEGKGATTLLLTKHAGKIRRTIKAHTADKTEQDAMWTLIRAYCQFGPLGLVDALDTDLPPLIPPELAEFARFHRLGKHPRSDAGIFIRGLLDRYADALGYARLPAFAARYAFVSNRKLKRWFVGENEQTIHLTKTHRRLNLDLPYPNRQWQIHTIQCPFTCRLTQYETTTFQPWLIWISDTHTHALQGVRLVPNKPTLPDLLATLRWSMWHYDAPWWTTRGIPEEVLISTDLATLAPQHQQALDYLHTQLTSASDTSEPLPTAIQPWIDERIEVHARIDELPTLAMVMGYLWSSVIEADATTISTLPPVDIREQAVSLPWSDGIAAVYLLPSLGIQTVNNGRITIHGVPYDAEDAGIADETVVEVFYDLDDARHVYLVHNGAHVAKAPAVTFTGGRIAWWDVALDPLKLIHFNSR